MKKIVTNKYLWIVVATIVVLAIIFFPHTNKTKVNGELTGVYTTVEERYFLHSMVELKTTNVCTAGVTDRVVEISYKLNGDIKEISTEYCDGSAETTIYYDGRYIIEEHQLNFLGNDIQTIVSEYNKVGLVTYVETFLRGVSSTTTYEYDNKNEPLSMSLETRKYDEVISKQEDEYIDGVLSESTYSEYDYGIITYERIVRFEDGALVYEAQNVYEEGALLEYSLFEVGPLKTTLRYTNDSESILFTATCEENICTINTFSTIDFELEFEPFGYPLEGGDFTLKDTETGIFVPGFNENVFEFSVNTGLFDYIDFVEEYLLDILND